MIYDHTDKELIALAQRNIEAFDKESELAAYVAFLFSELAALDADWEETIEADIATHKEESE